MISESGLIASFTSGFTLSGQAELPATDLTIISWILSYDMEQAAHVFQFSKSGNLMFQLGVSYGNLKTSIDGENYICVSAEFATE